VHRTARALAIWGFALACGLGCGRLGFASHEPPDADGSIGADCSLDARADGDADTRTDTGLDAGGPRTWRELGGSATGGGVSDHGDRASNLRVAVGPDGTTWVAWADQSSGNWDVHVRRWSGSAWEGVGGSDGPGGLTNDAAESRLGDIEVDAAGNAHICWMNFDTARSVYYRRWDGSAWVEDDGSATGRGVSRVANPWWPKMALDDAGRPTIGWEMYNVMTGRGLVYVRQWDGSTWEELDGSASGAGITGPGPGISVDVASGGGVIFVVWHGGAGAQQIFLRRWDGAGWSELGGSGSGEGLSDTTNTSSRPRLDVDAMGRPVVAWNEDVGGASRAYLRRWDGAAWAELAGSGSGDGLGVPRIPSSHVAVGVHASGDPVVAFDHDGGAGTNIFVRRWDGGAWTSADITDTGGISGTPTSSSWPHLTVGPDDDVYVFWEEEDASGAVEAHLRVLR